MSDFMENIYLPCISVLVTVIVCFIKEAAQGGLILYFCAVKFGAMNFPL